MKRGRRTGSSVAPHAGDSRGSGRLAALSLRSAAAVLLAVVILLPGSSCLFRRNKSSGPALPPQPIQLMLLPLNIPETNPELQWLGMSSTILLAKELENAPDIEVLPLWRGMPVAVEALGSSRSVTPEIAAFAASRAGSKWATQGEIATAGNGVKLLLDFIPVKATLIAYRYEQETSIESLGSHFREAIEQFLRYLQVRPLRSKSPSGLDSTRLKEISAAIDREYGWFSAADPGKAGSVFSAIGRTDDRLARLLFNPALYASPAARPATPTPQSSAPPAPSPNPARETAATGPSPPAAPPTQSRPSADLLTAATSSPLAKPATVPAELTRETPRTEVSPPEAPRIPLFSIQVHSSKKKSEAEAKAALLEKAGYRVQVVEVHLEGRGTWHRVRLTGYETRKAAEETAARLVAGGLIRDYWIDR